MVTTLVVADMKHLSWLKKIYEEWIPIKHIASSPILYIILFKWMWTFEIKIYKQTKIDDLCLPIRSHNFKLITCLCYTIFWGLKASIFNNFFTQDGKIIIRKHIYKLYCYLQGSFYIASDWSKLLKSENLINQTLENHFDSKSRVL